MAKSSQALATGRTWQGVAVVAWLKAPARGTVHMKVRAKSTGAAKVGGPISVEHIGVLPALRPAAGEYVLSEVIEVSMPTGKKFLRAGPNAIFSAVQSVATATLPAATSPWASSQKAAQNAASWDFEAAPKKRSEILDPDEIIDGGRDVMCSPSSTARTVYGGLMRSEVKTNGQTWIQAKRHAVKLEEWPAFIRELFSRLFDEDGCKRLEDEDRSVWGAHALNTLEGMAEWPALRASSQVSKKIAAGATAQLAEAVSAALGIDSMKTDQTTRRDPREVRAEGESIKRLMEMAGASEEQVAEALGGVEDRASRAAQVRTPMDARVEIARPQLAAAVRAAAAKAGNAAATIEAFAGIGFDREGPGSIEEACPELLEQVKLDPRMLRIIMWAGRTLDASDGALAKADGHCDVVGVVPTRDVAKLTPRTKADLASGGVRGLATMRDIMEGAAQGWEQRDTAPRNKGDAFLLVDRSGSMSGEPEVRARGLAVAALCAMLKQGRRVVTCSFASRGDALCAPIVPGDARALAAGIVVLCKRAGGGTDVDGAIVAAINAARTFPGGMRDPDALVITDGIFSPIAKHVLAALGDRRLFGVLIGMPDDGRHPEFDALWSIMGSMSEEDAARAVNAMRAPRRKRSVPVASSSVAGAP